MKTTIPVILIGASGLYEQGLQQVLKAHDFTVLAGAPALDAVDPALVARARIIIVLDPPDEPGLPQLVSQLRDRDPKLRFVLLIDTESSRRIATALRIPAQAFLCQKIACEPLLKALDVVGGGDGAVMSLDLMPYLLAAPRDETVPAASDPEAPGGSHTGSHTGSLPGSCRTLSDREVDILRCLTDGASNKLIARRFQIAESTVKIHVKGILRKINVRNRTQAAIWALAQPPAFMACAKQAVARHCEVSPGRSDLHP